MNRRQQQLLQQLKTATPNLSGNAIKLYLMMLTDRFDNGELYEKFLDDVAAKLNVSQRMVFKLLRELATAGLIKFETAKVLHVWIPDSEAGGAT